MEECQAIIYIKFAKRHVGDSTKMGKSNSYWILTKSKHLCLGTKQHNTNHYPEATINIVEHGGGSIMLTVANLPDYFHL